MSNRIKDFSVTATRPARDDYVGTDGATNNSRKLLAQYADDIVNAKAPRGGLAFDGSTANRIYATLNQDIGTDDFSFVTVITTPKYLPANQNMMTWLGSSSAGWSNPPAGRVSIGLVHFSNDQLRVDAIDSAFSITSPYSISGFTAKYGFGNTVVIVVTRTAMYINGEQVATAAMTQNISSSFLGFGVNHTNDIASGGVVLRSLSLYNFSLSASDVIDIYELGGAVPARFQWGNQTNQLVGADSDFSSATTGWSLTNGAAFDSNTTVAGKGYLTTGAAGTLTRISGGATLAPGKRWRVSIDARLASGVSQVMFLGDPNLPDAQQLKFTPTGTTATFTGTVDGAGNSSNRLVQCGVEVGNSTGVSSFELDNVKVIPLGAIVHLPLDDGYSYLLRDSSSNKLHAVMSTSGVSHIVLQNRPHHIRGTTNTNGNQQLFGQALVPANFQILRVRARAQSGTPTIFIGSTSGASDIAASFVLSTSWQDIPWVRTGTSSPTLATIAGGARTNTDILVKGMAAGDMGFVERADGTAWPQGILPQVVCVGDNIRLYYENITAGNIALGAITLNATGLKTPPPPFTSDTSFWVRSFTTDVIELDIEVEPLSA